ncbi:MAG: Mor transcription activator family protein [Peptostreptococcaceae bacterium]
MINSLDLKDVPENMYDIADAIGMEAFVKLIKLVGGNSIYFPNEINLTKRIRNRIIKESFNGGNYLELSRKYFISDIQIRNIIKYDK